MCVYANSVFRVFGPFGIFSICQALNFTKWKGKMDCSIYIVNCLKDQLFINIDEVQLAIYILEMWNCHAFVNFCKLCRIDFLTNKKFVLALVKLCMTVYKRF